MLPIQNFYTGQQAGTVIPELGKTEAAVARAYEKEQRLSELKYQDALMRRKELLDVSEVDPIDLIVDKMQEEQATKIEAFQKMVEDSYTKYKGDLPTDELLKLQRARRNIQGWQKEQLATQERFLKGEAMFRSRPGYFDNESWDRTRATMYETGKYDPAGLQIRSIDADGAFLKFAQSKESGIESYSVVDTTITPEGSKQSTSIGYVADEDRIKDASVRYTLGNEPQAVTRAREYKKLSDEVKAGYIRMAEEDPVFLGNPILAYAYDRDRKAFEALKQTKRGDKGVKDYRDKRGFSIGFGWYVDDDLVAEFGTLSASKFLKGQEGMVLSQASMKGNTVSLDASTILDLEPGVEVVGNVQAYPVFISNNKVEWLVANAKTALKKYELDSNGNKRVYENLPSQEIKSGKYERVPGEQYRFYKIDPVSTAHVTTNVNDYKLSLNTYIGQGWDEKIKELVPKVEILDFKTMFGR